MSVNYKTSALSWDWKSSVFILIPKKAMPKNVQNHTIELILHTSKIILKNNQARLQQYVNRELQMYRLGLGKSKKQRSNSQHVLNHGKSNEFLGKQNKTKHLLLLHWLCYDIAYS